jgi:hypothetical protein
MKTLGQIAYEATAGSGRFEWQDLVKHDREVWEAAAQAVRASVIEECAKVCEKVDCASCCADELRDLLKGKQ